MCICNEQPATLFFALTHTHTGTPKRLSHGSRGPNVENAAMGQTAFRKCRTGVPVSALHIENAAILGDRCGDVVCHLLPGNGNAQLHLHECIHMACKLKTKTNLSHFFVLVIFCNCVAPPAAARHRQTESLHSLPTCSIRACLTSASL